ncbi:hypothetical protein [Paenibacillus alvei]|uniref:hypothetical protein n=1 Tax=Paenibacillus alvei TaxID=44250 RepID=UPI0013DA05C4|nr:hypothetical protein [Paenibacillus alvei]NEZ43030.1 hypothetical protein [Paenibacillus alvei]
MKKAALLLAVMLISWLLAGCGQAVQHTYDKVNQVVTDYGKEKSLNKEKVFQVAKEGLRNLYDISISEQDWNLICGFSKYYANQDNTKPGEGHVTFIATLQDIGERKNGISGFYGEVNLKTGELFKLGLLMPSIGLDREENEVSELQEKAQSFIVERLRANERTLHVLNEKNKEKGVFLFQDAELGMRYVIRMNVEQKRVIFFKKWIHS